MKPTTLFIYSICLAFLTGCSTSDFYLVRHAEKMDNSADPDLSPIGAIRAEALRDSLSNKKIDLLYATSYLRTQQTLMPLAAYTGKEILEYDGSSTFAFVETLRQIKGKNIVVAGHSNTIPDMVRYLTGDTVHIGHDDYAFLFHIRKTSGLFHKKYRLLIKKYGAD